LRNNKFGAASLLGEAAQKYVARSTAQDPRAGTSVSRDTL
jgi:hypothetical protein